MYRTCYPSSSMLRSTSFSTYPMSNYIQEDIINNILEPSEELGGVYIGNLDAASSYEVLEQYNIKSVLTVAAQTGLKYDESIIFNHEVILADDNPYFDLHKYFMRMCNFIDHARKSGSVLVHCFAGISRSSSAVIAYLMKTQGWTYEKAFHFCKNKRR